MQQRVGTVRAAAAKRERELARQWAARRNKKIQRREGERLPKELFGSCHALAQQDPLAEEVDTRSSTSDLVQPKEVVRQHDLPTEEENLPHVEDSFPSEDDNLSLPGEEGGNSPETACTTTLLVTVPRRRRSVDQNLERSIAWLRFFYFAGRRRNSVVEASVSHTLLEARWHTLLPRTIAVTL